MGARLGGDQGTRGELLGLLGQFGKVGSATEGLAQAEAIRQALTAGRGDDTPLTRSLLNVAGSLAREGGMVGSLAENAALIGTTSLSGGPMMADTRALQVSRAVRGTSAKEMERIEAEFGIKVGSKEGLEARLAKIVPKLRQIGKTEDVSSWLTRNIGTSQENAQALIEIMENYEVFTERAKLARETATAGGAKVMAENEAWRKTPMGRRMLAEAEGEAAKHVQGERVEGYQAMVAAAQAGIEARDPTALNNLKSSMHSVARLGLGWLGVGSEAEETTNAALAARLKRAGMSDPFNTPWGAFRGMFMSPADRGNEMIGLLRSKGIDPSDVVGEGVGSQIATKLDRLIDLQEMANRQRDEGNRDRKAAADKPRPLGRGAPAPMPARP
jgi:hypothetical protein